MSLVAELHLRNAQVALDIGSTVIKVAMLAEDRTVAWQRFYPRDFRAGIVKQVETLLESLQTYPGQSEIRVCSSANGGLRVGIVCLTKRFSGAVLRDQVLMACANPVFIHDCDEGAKDVGYIDILVVGGGIDCDDAAPLGQRLKRLDLSKYRYGRLLFAGNKYLAGDFLDRFPTALVIPNPLAEKLIASNNSVFETIRRAYLDDLVYKEGISELKDSLAVGVRPTPEVVSVGFQRTIANSSLLGVISPCVLLDIGGATTDLHYTAEIIKNNGEVRRNCMAGSSVARYVFTDLGIVASRDSLLLQLRSHPRLYEFLSVTVTENVTEVYRLLREGEYQPSPELLAYGCLFLALDRFAQGRGPGLPSGDVGQLAQVVLTGGGSQPLMEDTAADVVGLLLSKTSNPGILIDRSYQIWVQGTAFTEQEVGVATV